MKREAVAVAITEFMLNLPSTFKYAWLDSWRVVIYVDDFDHHGTVTA
jgi:hypothetical protein